MARNLYAHRDLIWRFALRDVQGRYKGSYLGMLWSFITPLLMLSVYTFVFGVVLNAKFEKDPSRSGFVLYFFAGMLPWLAFSEAVGRSATVMLDHRNFVRSWCSRWRRCR